jgi:hypothetical protein
MHFGMWTTHIFVGSAPNHHAIPIDNNGTHHWVRARSPASAFGNRQRARHVVGVGEH